MPIPVVLLTDFGLTDSYVGAMKGKILSVSPGIPIIDLTHEIPRYDIQIASIILSDNLPYFPDQCIFCCVVDPGVGSSRKPIALKLNLRWFIGPDNGLFGFLLDQPGIEAYEISHPLNASNTFHGRDLFAPIAAQLALGKTSVDSWPILSREELIQNEIPTARREPDIIRGKILYADHFGNLVTNILSDDLDSESEIEFDGRVISLYRFYEEMPQNSLCALIGSTGRLEISVKNGSAQAHSGWSVQTQLEVSARIFPNPKSC